jgi:hypothetical protein
MFTISLVYLAPVAYLIIGDLLMILVNEILDGAVTRGEFLLGMVIWPILLLGGIFGFFRYLFVAGWRKLHG